MADAVTGALQRSPGADAISMVAMGPPRA